METEQDEVKRRKYVGVGGDDTPSMGVLEGDILKLLWDAGEPLNSVQVYEAMHFTRRREKREMHSPSTVAVTLSRMVVKGLLAVERRPRGGKGYYNPTRTRAEVTSDMMNDVILKLTGQPLGYILTRLQSDAAGKSFVKSNAGDKKSADTDAGLHELINVLHKLRHEDNKPLPIVTETW